jgi:DNA-binding XRE family transcriptional regulator
MAKGKDKKSIPDDDVVLKRVGENIVALRKKMDMSQKDLAYEIEYDKANLRKIERGRANPTTKTLLKICRVLKCSIPDLFQ